MSIDKILDKVIRDCGKYKKLVKKTMAFSIPLPEKLAQYDPATRLIAVADGIIESAKAAKKNGVEDTEDNREFVDKIATIIKISAGVMRKSGTVVVE